MVDFTNCKINRFKTFGGANGHKIGIWYQDESYMLKFPNEAKLNKELSYAHGPVSEYIGCKIYEAIGIPVQKVILGTYESRGRIRRVVACKDMETEGYRLREFATIKNTLIDSVRNGYGTDLEEVLCAIDTQELVSARDLKKRFWDMFIVDAFIGNFDRHNGNWGFLVNEELERVKIAPVYDCGSCLFSEMDELLMKRVMREKKELDYRLYVIPKSALMIKGKKINYFDFLKSNQNIDCTRSLIDIAHRIDMKKIWDIIEQEPLITETEKAFYKFMLSKRYDKIIVQAKKEVVQDKSIGAFAQPKKPQTIKDISPKL